MQELNEKKQKIAEGIKRDFQGATANLQISFNELANVKMYLKKGSESPDGWIKEKRTYFIPGWVVEGCSLEEIFRAALELNTEEGLSWPDRLLGEYDLYTVKKNFEKILGLKTEVVILEGKIAKCYYSSGSIFVSRELLGRFSRQQIALATLAVARRIVTKNDCRKGHKRPVVSVSIDSTPCLIEKELLDKMAIALRDDRIVSDLKKIELLPDGIPGSFNN